MQFSADETRKQRPSGAAQWSLYVMLLAMSATDLLRAPSAALRPHANGLGAGYTSFRYSASGPSLQHLIARTTLSDQISLVTHQDDGLEGPAGDIASEPSTDHHQVSEHCDDEECIMEIEDEAPIPNPSGYASLVLAAPATEAAVRPHPQSLTGLPLNALETILEFLPVRDINRVRGLSLSFGMAATRICPQPLGDGITFVRLTGLAELPTPTPNPHAPPVPFVWRCVNCSGYSSYHEACTNCRTNIRVGGCRVFLGQVRKQHTAEAIRCLLRVMLPDVELMHIESHSNKDGFEKGAAWVYVNTPEQAHSVTQLHKRVFFDSDCDGGEGFWVVDDADLETQLEQFAATRKQDERRRHRPLPGQPLVAEFPTTSMLRGFKPSPLHAASSEVVRGANGWYHM